MLPHGLLAYFSCVLQGSMTSLTMAPVAPWLCINDLQEKLIYQHVLWAGNLRLAFGVEGQGDPLALWHGACLSDLNRRPFGNEYIVLMNGLELAV